MSWIVVLAGVLFAIVLIVIIATAGRARRSRATRRETQTASPLGDLEEYTCQNCGGELSRQHITLEGGNRFVRCPFCGSEYRMRER
jgi:DNA-directed RNA polymerase subunit RPC12/RpoP